MCLIAGLFSSANALQLRDAANTSNNQRFTGNLNSPATLSANPSFLLSGFDTTGVGWYVQDTRRQFAMISPRHFVCASHFRPSNNGQVRFLGSDGQVYTYEILSTQIISDSNGQTDLSLGTLEEAVDTSVITPFRFADFAQDNSYTGSGYVFGRTVLAGQTALDSVLNLSDLGLSVNARVDNTRFLLFTYNIASGDPDDAFLEPGDSGSPAFLPINGELTLLSTNSLIGENDTIRFTFAAFVPFYRDELNASMADEGFQLSSHNPGQTSLVTQESISVTLRESYPGTITLDITNNGIARANNLEIRLNQLAEHPTSLSGTGFTSRTDGNQTFIINKAFLDPNESALLTLTWDAIPASNPFAFDISVQADETTESLLPISQPVIPSFLGFVGDATNQDATGDDDGDGRSNLAEYALGGDLTISSSNTPQGVPLGLSFADNGSSMEVSFLRRTDALTRGLTYSLLSGESFPLTNPIDISSATVTNSLEPGFELVTHTLLSPSDSQFFTLKLELDEEP